jgi:hypothetical protein
VTGERDGLAAPELSDRLAALKQLCAGVPRRERRGVDLHLHTNYSFSSFASPCEAVFQAVEEGLRVLGINDHYTVEGHDEFRAACGIAGMAATFSMEAVAMDRECESRGVLINDPGNPGRAYLSAKGVTKYPRPGQPGARELAGLRAALERRNREMTAKVGAVFEEKLAAPGPSWDDVVGLTPAGNTTERHLAKAAYFRLVSTAGGAEGAAALAARLCGSAPEKTDESSMQGFLRSKLLKAGGSCYVEESPEAFLSLEEMRALYLHFGAIPTYPALLNPVTDFERDVGGLLEELESRGWIALEVIPFRNTRERLGACMAEAVRRHWPVFAGTEHNTPEPKPLLDQFSLDPKFEEWFLRSARVLLGHQRERAAGRPGFVTESGEPSISDPRERFEHFEAAGLTTAG